jgi:hypothetical protein
MVVPSRYAAAELHRQELYAEAAQERLLVRARPLSAIEPISQKLPRLRLSLVRFLARHMPVVLVLDQSSSR